MSKYIAPGHIVTQERDLYRVDGWLVAPEAIPPTTLVPFELEMVCFEQPAWHDLKGPFICCEDYGNAGQACVPPNAGDYRNVDIQDQDTDVTICDSYPEYDFPVAGTLGYENADVQPRGSGIPEECL